jgi:hypothetical protein
VKILDGEVHSLLGVHVQARVIEIVVQWLRKWGASGGGNDTVAPRGVRASVTDIASERRMALAREA